MHVARKCRRFRENDMHQIKDLKHGRILFGAACLVAFDGAVRCHDTSRRCLAAGEDGQQEKRSQGFRYRRQHATRLGERFSRGLDSEYFCVPASGFWPSFSDLMVGAAGFEPTTP